MPLGDARRQSTVSGMVQRSRRKKINDLKAEEQYQGVTENQIRLQHHRDEKLRKERLFGISYNEYEGFMNQLDPTLGQQYNTVKSCYGFNSKSTYYCILVMYVSLIGFSLDVDALTVLYYSFVQGYLTNLDQENLVIWFLSVYSFCSYFSLWMLGWAVTGCTCGTIYKNEQKPDQEDSVAEGWIAWKNCSILCCCNPAIAIGNPIEDNEPLELTIGGEKKVEDQADHRARLYNRLDIRWWMLMPFMRTVLLFSVNGNIDKMYWTKPMQQVQYEKAITFKAIAVLGQVNMFTATIPSALIGIIRAMEAPEDTGNLIFVTFSLFSLFLTACSFCFGCLDSLVNFIDDMDAILLEKSLNQRNMNKVMIYCYHHLRSLRNCMDELIRLVRTHKAFEDAKNSGDLEDRTCEFRYRHQIARATAALCKMICQDEKMRCAVWGVSENQGDVKQGGRFDGLIHPTTKVMLTDNDDFIGSCYDLFGQLTYWHSHYIRDMQEASAMVDMINFKKDFPALYQFYDKIDKNEQGTGKKIATELYDDDAKADQSESLIFGKSSFYKRDPGKSEPLLEDPEDIGPYNLSTALNLGRTEKTAKKHN